jgi:hypothetical protein
MTWVACWVLLAVSVSSILRMNVPPVCLAYSQLNRAVLAPPICRKPVGLGANLTLTFINKTTNIRYYQKIRHILTDGLIDCKYNNFLDEILETNVV